MIRMTLPANAGPDRSPKNILGDEPLEICGPSNIIFFVVGSAAERSGHESGYSRHRKFSTASKAFKKWENAVILDFRGIVVCPDNGWAADHFESNWAGESGYRCEAGVLEEVDGVLGVTQAALEAREAIGLLHTENNIAWYFCMLAVSAMPMVRAGQLEESVANLLLGLAAERLSRSWRLRPKIYSGKADYYIGKTQHHIGYICRIMRRKPSDESLPGPALYCKTALDCRKLAVELSLSGELSDLHGEVMMMVRDGTSREMVRMAQSGEIRTSDHWYSKFISEVRLLHEALDKNPTEGAGDDQGS